MTWACPGVLDPFADDSGQLSTPRTPGWRWTQATEHWSLDQRWEAMLDEDLRRVAEDIFEPGRVDNGVLVAMRLVDVSRRRFGNSKSPNAVEALSIFTDRPHMRCYLEGMALCGVTTPCITAMTGLRPGVVNALETLFFDVKPYLRHEAWIAETVFGGAVSQRTDRHDHFGVFHRIAWLMGPQVFHAIRGGGRMSPELDMRLDACVVEMTRRAAVLRSICRGRMDEEMETSVVTSIINEAFVTARAEAESNNSARTGGFDGKHIGQIIGMFVEIGSAGSGKGIKVADPSDPANLQQPARDRRAIDVVSAPRTLELVEAQ